MTSQPVNSDDVVDAYVADWNARIGESRPVGVTRKSHRDYCIAHRHISDDLIRQFVVCHGDANPLWRDTAYAKASPWGQLIAPPMQMLSVSAATRLPPPPEVENWTMMAAGAIYEVDRPLLPGDVIDADDVWMGIVERSKPDRPNRTFILTAERRFKDAAGRPVGKFGMRVFATTPRHGVTPEAARTAPPRQRPRYTQEQLDEIYAHYDAENAGQLRRGAQPRYFEDVKVGDTIGKVIKGPVDVLDSASFVAMAGGGIGFAEKWMLIKDELHLSPRDPETNAYHFNFSWHLDDGCARAMGQPYALNFGTLLEVNCSHALTNWAGDHGFVRIMDNRILAPMYLGETATVTGVVSKVWEEDGRGLVEIQLKVAQQDGIDVGSQRAVVQLPHRGRPDEVIDAVKSHFPKAT